jgi:hypothetical protein
MCSLSHLVYLSLLTYSYPYFDSFSRAALIFSKYNTVGLFYAAYKSVKEVVIGQNEAATSKVFK